MLGVAAVDRIHKVIEKKGFEVFNQTSSYMKAQTTGRYKRFTKEFSVTSISELQLVFDSDLLWVLEGMQRLILMKKHDYQVVLICDVTQGIQELRL